MNKKKLFASILLLLLSLSSCKDPDETEPIDVFMMFMTVICDGPDSFSTVFTDMQDGTIKREERYDFYGGCGNETHTVQSTIYIKKCLQGQVYRPAQNDCQGTGAAPDWGAVKFQFCPTNDRACEMQVDGEWVADPTKSPAAMSCAGDTTAGRSWRMPAIFGDLNFPVDIRPYFPEIPYGVTNLIWENDPYFAATSDTYSFDINGLIVYGNDLNKNTNQYVQCFSN